MAILMMLNLKGGVAKTTNCVAIAECLADQGHRVLVIDADHQCMASELLLGEERLFKLEHQRKTFHDMLANMLDDDFSPEGLPHYIVEQASNIGGGMPRLDVIPCSIRIDDFQTNMTKARRGHHTNDEFLVMLDRKRRTFQRFLKYHYDTVLIDCPPSLAVQVRYLLRVADAYIIPCIPDRLSVRGSLWLADRLRRAGYTRVEGLGTLWSLYRQQNAMHKHTIERAAAGADEFVAMPKPFTTVIPNATAIAHATDPDFEPATFGAKYSPAFAKLYRELSAEILGRLNGNAPVPVRATEL